jgi:hypothetical protein
MANCCPADAYAEKCDRERRKKDESQERANEAASRIAEIVAVARKMSATGEAIDPDWLIEVLTSPAVTGKS